MGIALAKVLAARGAEIKVVHGYLEESLPPDLKSIKCESVNEMEEEIFSDFKDFTVIIKAAAVGDYKFKNTRKNKLKKSRNEISFDMEKTTDILKRIGKEKKSSQILIGFSAETKNTVKNSKKKIKDKNLDLIVANDVSIENTGFGQDNNFTYLVSRSNEVEDLGLISKRNLSIKIGDYIKKIRMELPER